MANINSPNIVQSVTTATSAKSTAELAKVLKSFTMLEKEFNVDHPPIKLEESLIRLQPPISFQDETKSNLSTVLDRKDRDGPKVYENILVNGQTPQKKIDDDYENVVISSKHKTYENVEVKRKSLQDSPKTPPTPLPRQGVPDVKVSPLVPLPRNATSKVMKEDFDEIHDCKVVTEESQKKKETKNISELPRLIKFLPKVVSATVEAQSRLLEETDAGLETLNDSQNDVIVKKCIPMVNGDSEENYVDSSSDEDIEKVYEPNAMDKRDSSDTLSDEDGEKLGPPDIIDGPGPSEAYFNFHWSPNMLPTIGEVEEEFSSLEVQQTGYV